MEVNIKELIGLITILLTFGGMIPYLLSTFKGKIRPHFISWTIWSIITAIAFFTQLSKGAGAGAWATGATTLLNITIAVFAFKNGTRKINIYEKVLFVSALFTSLIWILVNNPVVSIILVMLVDGTGVFFTVRKAFKDPKSENPTPFYANILKNLLAISALQSYNFVTLIYLIYQLGSNTSLLLSTKPKWIWRFKKN